MEDWGGCVTAEGVATLSCIFPLFQNAVNAALIFAGVVALFFILFAGVKFITSGGDAKQVDGARQTLTYAIIGLVIILLSFFVINIIARTTGANCINNFSFDCEKQP